MGSLCDMGVLRRHLQGVSSIETTISFISNRFFVFGKLLGLYYHRVTFVGDI